jgi:hypothetical protein
MLIVHHLEISTEQLLQQMQEKYILHLLEKNEYLIEWYELEHYEE